MHAIGLRQPANWSELVLTNYIAHVWPVFTGSVGCISLWLASLGDAL